MSSKTFERMGVAHPQGGYLFLGLTEEEAAAQRKAIWEMINNIGKHLAQGKNLTHISFPVSVFEPRSYLQRLVDGWWAAPVFLQKASETDDPLLRFKLVMTFAIAGFHNTCAQMKPFNPILGETHQAYFKDGTQINCEQSSHHPPVTNFLVIGPNDSYRFYGFGEWHASFRGNTVKGHQRGPHYVEFSDGTIISYTLPWMNVHGIITGERIIEYEGVMEFRDEKNGFSCDLEINPKTEGGFLQSWFSKSKLPTDYFKGVIVNTDTDEGKKDSKKISEESVICSVLGSWLGCIEFGEDERIWDWQDDNLLSEPIPIDTPLPSDCRFRDDVNFLGLGDKIKSQELKTVLEEKQRYEAKLRKEGAKLLKKRAKQIKKGKIPAREPRIFKRPEARPKSARQSKKKGKKKDKKKEKEAGDSKGGDKQEMKNSKGKKNKDVGDSKGDCKKKKKSPSLKQNGKEKDSN